TRGSRVRLEADRERRKRRVRLRWQPHRLVGARDPRWRRGLCRDQAHRVRQPRRRERDLRARPAGRRLPRSDGPHREARPMTPIRQRIGVALQWIGLVGAVLGLIATPFFGLGLAPQWIIGGAIAIALDVIAIRTDADVRAMLAALAKLVILVTALFAFT